MLRGQGSDMWKAGSHIAVGFRFEAKRFSAVSVVRLSTTRYDRLSWLRGAAAKSLPNLWHLSASAGLGATRHLNSQTYVMHPTAV